MLIYSVASLLLIYSLISSTERPLSGVIRALSFLALSLAGTVLSYYWILMSQRYFHFSDEGICLFDKHKKRYNVFYKWSDFPKVYVFYRRNSYRIIFTTEELNSEEQFRFLAKSHMLDPFVKGYDGFIISTFDVDKKLDHILKEKYGIGYPK